MNQKLWYDVFNNPVSHSYRSFNKEQCPSSSKTNLTDQKLQVKLSQMGGLWTARNINYWSPNVCQESKGGLGPRIDNYVKKLIVHYYSGEKKSLYISSPIFKHTNNYVYILIYCYISSSSSTYLTKNNVAMSSRKLIEGNPIGEGQGIAKLKKIIKNIYNKEVILRVIKLKKPHDNAEILAKYVGLTLGLSAKHNNKAQSPIYKIKQPHQLTDTKYHGDFSLVQKSRLTSRIKRVTNLRHQRWLKFRLKTIRRRKNNFIKYYNRLFSKFFKAPGQIFSNLNSIPKHNTLLKDNKDKDQIIKNNKALYIKKIFSRSITGLKVELHGRFNKRRSASRTVSILKKKGCFSNQKIEYANYLSKSKNGSYNFKFSIATSP